MRVGHAFYRPSQIKFKTEKLLFCQINCGQMKHNFRKLKEVFFKHIFAFNPMVLISINKICMDCGVHFVKPIFAD